MPSSKPAIYTIKPASFRPLAPGISAADVGALLGVRAFLRDQTPVVHPL